MDQWREWDEEYADALRPRLFYETGDLTMRSEMTPDMEQSIANWDVLRHPYEVPRVASYAS